MKKLLMCLGVCVGLGFVVYALSKGMRSTAETPNKDLRSQVDSAIKTLGAALEDLEGQEKLADLYQEQGDLTKAESLYKKAIENAESTLGPADIRVSMTLGKLASLYKKQGELTKAQPLLERKLEIIEKAFGANSYHIAVELNQLAEVYDGLGEVTKAETLYKRALEVREKANVPIFSKSLENLAALYRKTNRAAEAKELEARAEKIKVERR